MPTIFHIFLIIVFTRYKEFHLKRLKNNYFPVDGENISFVERQNWILRHRLDYNNVLELNHYDMIYSKSSNNESEE